MPKYQLYVYTDELYAEVLIDAPDEPTAFQRAYELTGDELMRLDWQISDDALSGYNLKANYSVDEANIETFEGARSADVTVAGEGA